MSGLRERMGRLRGGGAASQPEETALAREMPAEGGAGQPGPQETGERLSPEWESIGVRLMTNAHGSFLLRRAVYPASLRHGNHRLEQLAEAAAGLAAFHAGSRMEASDILFLDLETTGLGVGAGNVPFMVGIGFLRGGSFVIEQTLLRHPAEERAMLHYLQSLLVQFRFLATYNGRTFDWPVVQNRFILNGFKRDVWQPAHLDFLHPARSVWRNTLASCKLSRVEEERLGIERKDDVPGSLAPQIYFQFLADGRPQPLEGVFRHNEIDMLSLACLAVRFGYLLDEEDGGKLPVPAEPEELVRTGLWLERMGRHLAAERMFAAAERSERASVSTLLLLASRDKKAGNWSRAVLLWQKAVERQSPYGTAVQEAYVELAMYYEHKLKNYELALHYTKEAMELALGSPFAGRKNPKLRAELDSLRKRLDRLHRKTRSKLG